MNFKESIEAVRVGLKEAIKETRLEAMAIIIPIVIYKSFKGLFI